VVFPEDRVLVGVINRKRDLDKALHEHWYRIPQPGAPQGIHAEYIAFFLSRAFKELNGGIHYYARRTGIELVRRRDLLPDEANHSRADDLYHKLQFGEMRRKDPPVLNPTKRPIVFIYTTWDRFEQARVIADLYSDADHFVDRVFHALEPKIKREGGVLQRVWEAERTSDDGGAQLRVECEDGTVIASTAARSEHVIPLHVINSDPQAVRYSVETLLEAIRQHGGPLMINVPLEE
jgi:hypothetical protein